MHHPQSEKTVLRRLLRPRSAGRRGPQFSLRWLMIIMTVAPAVIWLISLTWEAIPETPERTANDLAASRDTPLVYHSLLPLSLTASVCCSGVFLVIRFGRRRAKFITLVVCTACGAVLTVAVILLISDGAGNVTAANAKLGDWVVTLGLPLTSLVAATAIIACQIADLE